MPRLPGFARRTSGQPGKRGSPAGFTAPPSHVRAPEAGPDVNVPIGYLIAVGVTAVGLLLSVRPLGRSGWRGTLSWFVSVVPNESPFAALYWMLAVTLLAQLQGDLGSPVAWVGLAFAALSLLVMPILVARSLRARPAVDSALDVALGSGWRGATDPALRSARRLPWLRIVLAPLPFFSPGVRRIGNVAYGDAGRQNQLDVYRRRSGGSAGPILIHLHGGYFRSGRKSFEARPLLHRLAGRGWVCISANYRLRPAATFPDYLVDVKKVIAWAREHAGEHGGDTAHVFLAGSSAGAHLAMTAALTENDPAFQPGFEHADTTVSGAIGLYGYYGPVDGKRQPLPSSPADYAHPGAPPLLIAHGDQDTFPGVPPEHARAFVAAVRAAATEPVVHVELPGAQHSFDLVHSIRFETVVGGIEDFAAWVRARAPRSARRRSSPSPAAIPRLGTGRAR
jgi:acetyl esterase/lipase